MRNDPTSIFEIINQTDMCHKAEKGTVWYLTTGWWKQWFLLSAITAVKCHCQLLFSACHGLCEIHFLCLNTFCQARKDPNSNLLWPVFDREHLTANGCTAWLHLSTVFHNGFIFFTLVYSNFTPTVSLDHHTLYPYIDLAFQYGRRLFSLLPYTSFYITVNSANIAC